MKQTAVEWLFEQIDRERYLTDNEMYHLIKQAKAMEKEQIIEAYRTGVEEDVYSNPLKTGEQYYNETFKSENIVMFMTPENGEIESIILTDNPDCGVKGIIFKSE